MKFKTYLEQSDNISFLYDDLEFLEELEKVLGTKTVLNELSATVDVFPQVWGDIDSNSDEDMITQAKNIYKKAKDIAVSVKNKFTNLLKRASQFKNSKVLVDIKGVDAFIDKAVNRYPKKGKGASNITDVLRSAILVTTRDEVIQTVKNIKKLFTVAKHQEKKVDDDPKYGYFGSHHFYVKVGEILGEIQVMTKKLWTYKEEAHKIYNKYRSIEVANKDIEKLDTKLSKRIFQLGNMDKGKLRKKGKPELPKRETKYKNYKIRY